MSRHEISDPINEIPEAGRYRWVVFGTYVACNTSGFLIANNIGILLPAMSEDLGISPTRQGMLSAAPFWANLTLMIAISWWVSRYPPKLLVLATMVLGAIALFLQGWAPTFAMLMSGRLAFGVTMIAREPARSLLIKQWLPQREVNISGGISNLFFGILVSGGFLLTPILLEFFDGNWRSVMHVSGAYFLSLGLGWLLLGKERPEVKSYKDESIGGGELNRDVSMIRRIFQFQEVWIAGFGFTGALMSFASFNGFMPTMVLEAYGIPLAKSGLIAALYVLPGGLSGVVVGYMIKGTEYRRPILIVSGVIIAVSFYGMTLTDSYVSLLCLATVNGLAWGFFPVLYMVPFHLKDIRPRETAIAVAVIMSMASLGASAGPTLTGYLQETMGSLPAALRLVALSPLTIVVSGFLLPSNSRFINS